MMNFTLTIYFCCVSVDGCLNAKEKEKNTRMCAIAPDSSSAQCIRKKKYEREGRKRKKNELKRELKRLKWKRERVFFLQGRKKNKLKKRESGARGAIESPRNRCNYL